MLITLLEVKKSITLQTYSMKNTHEGTSWVTNQNQTKKIGY